MAPDMQHGTSHPEAHRYTDERRAATARGARVAAACAVGLLPMFAYLDTILFPPPAQRFVEWRLASIGTCAAVFFLVSTRLGRRYPLVLGALVPLSVGLNIDAITLVAGRETNPYYAGLIVTLLGVSLLLPWTPRAALLVSTLMVGSYAGGMLATGPIADVPLFTSNLLLLVASAVLVVVGAAVSDRLRRREFHGRMTLDAHARRQEAVARLGQLALGGTAPHDLMEQATALVAETLGFELAAVLELRADGKALVVQSGTGWKPGVVGRATAVLDARSHARHALDASAPLFTDDLAAEKRFKPMAVLRDHAAVSGVCVRIAGRERAFGLLVAYSADARVCNTPEIECLESLAAVLTTAILREEAELARATEAHTGATLARVGRDLISSLEAPVLLQRLCETSAEALGTDHSVTWLLDPQQQVFRPISGHGMPPDKWESLRALRLPSTAIAALLEKLAHDELVEITPASHDHPVAAGIINHLGITRSLLLPLRRTNEVIGVLANGYRGRTEPFTRQQHQLAHGISQLASMALSNARLVEELERASRLKSEFVSTMSHELRTPLNVIVGYLDILADELGSDEHCALLGRARSASLELLDMIEATLNLNRIAAGQDPPIVTEVHVADLWQELETDFAALPRKTGVALRWEPAGDVRIRTDRRKLKIIVKNLVGNALKFTPTGEVCVRVAVEGAVCAVTVRDTGIGIPESHLPHIFEMFRQVDSSDARSYAGAGLGLYIVKSLLAQLGGDVAVESTSNRGSTFRVSLPLATPVVLTASVENAAATARVADRAAPEAALSANASHAATNAAVAEEPDAVATADQRLAAVESHAATTHETARAVAPAPVAPRRPRRIVFADDLEVNRHLLKRFLARAMPDVECFEACDGLQALALVEAHKPDLVLLDLRMPEMDGWQAARRIRALENGRDIPIIALSVTASPGAEAYAIHAGCNEFVAKPVSDYGGLLSRITHWLGPSGSFDENAGPSDADLCVLCRQPLPSAFIRAAANRD